MLTCIFIGVLSNYPYSSNVKKEGKLQKKQSQNLHISKIFSIFAHV